jgi:DNA-binding LytR/AlgR family response regulator
MIRAIIVDDEELARRSLRQLLEQETDVEISSEAENGIEALERITRINPDLVFLDIEMPGLNGFEVLTQIATPPVVVFATAYDDYAVRAFEANAIDYLLKPINIDRLRQTLSRVRKALNDDRTEYEETLRRVLSELHRERGTTLNKLAVHQKKKILLLPFSEILSICVEDTLVFANTATQRFLCDRSLGELERLLGEGFFRISRQEIINLEHLREIVPWFSGAARIVLSNNSEHDVSRERTRQLRRLSGLS